MASINDNERELIEFGEAEALAKVAINRAIRYLSATDWTQLPDTLTPEKTKDFADYRTALRDYIHAIEGGANPDDLKIPDQP